MTKPINPLYSIHNSNINTQCITSNEIDQFILHLHKIKFFSLSGIKRELFIKTLHPFWKEKLLTYTLNSPNPLSTIQNQPISNATNSDSHKKNRNRMEDIHIIACILTYSKYVRLENFHNRHFIASAVLGLSSINMYDILIQKLASYPGKNKEPLSIIKLSEKIRSLNRNVYNIPHEAQLINLEIIEMADNIIITLNKLWDTNFTCQFHDKIPSKHEQLHNANLDTRSKVTQWFNKTISPQPILQAIYNSTFIMDYKSRTKATNNTNPNNTHNHYNTNPHKPTPSLNFPPSLPSVTTQHPTTTQITTTTIPSLDFLPTLLSPLFNRKTQRFQISQVPLLNMFTPKNKKQKRSHEMETINLCLFIEALTHNDTTSNTNTTIQHTDSPFTIDSDSDSDASINDQQTYTNNITQNFSPITCYDYTKKHSNSNNQNNFRNTQKQETLTHLDILTKATCIL